MLLDTQEKLDTKELTQELPITALRKNYVGATPALRIRQFNMGNPMLPYTTVGELVVTKSIDIRIMLLKVQDKVLTENL